MNDEYSARLQQIKNNFTEMGVNVSEQIYQSTNAFLDHDKKVASLISDHDSHINKEEINLENDALKIMALQQPVADDFRFIISILKSSADLERIGDHAESIAQETLRMHRKDKIADIDELVHKMTLRVREMLESSLDAYLHNDEAAARLVSQEDIEIDRLFVQARTLLLKEIEADTKKIPSVASYLLVVRLLERIGDHIVNIDEWVVYNKSGEIVELNPGKIQPNLIKEELDLEAKKERENSSNNEINEPNQKD